MLLQLDIRNVALIDKISIDMASGLSVLTGETGAGKSILIDSINAVLGDRIGKDIVRTGTDKAVVEAVFSSDSKQLISLLDELGVEIEEGDNLILSREISINGKNTCRINGRLVNLSALKQVGGLLIDIHGQHDNQSLLKTESHIQFLDDFGGAEIQSIKKEYSSLFSQYKEIKHRQKSLLGDKGEIARRLDMLKFQIDEIKDAKLKEGEDDLLFKQRQLLANSEKIVSALATSYDLLAGGNSITKSIIYNANKALTELSYAVKYDEALKETHEKLESVIYQLEDISEEIRNRRDESEFSPEQLAEIDERLDTITRLKRKYGVSIAEIKDFYSRAIKEYDELTQSEELSAKLSQMIHDLEAKMFSKAKELNNVRRLYASQLEEKITNELDGLEMKNAKFSVNLVFDDQQRHFHNNGLDKAEFMISTNAGEPQKPLSKIASGGEMSRIMLAIKIILANVDFVPTLIFDEIDTGISGKAAQRVGQKLAQISKTHQVLCVTHLSQLACMADNHYLIEKYSEDESTFTRVVPLDGENRVLEISRIIGGADVTKAAKQHSEELIKAAIEFKKQL